MTELWSHYAQDIGLLNKKWVPHEGQRIISSPLIAGQVDQVFAQCGRNFGKTELVIYLLWRWALSHWGSENYYFSPFQKQSREILWASQRIQGFGGREHLEGKPNETEMRLRFANGSFIKLDGSDNFDSYRGVKPRGLVIYDEYKDFRPEFHIAFEPNLAAHGAKLLIIGTPPERDSHYTELAEIFKKSPDKKYYEMPTSMNPHIPMKWLNAKQRELHMRGEDDVWEREYMARFVKGGRSSIFPMLNNKCVIDHDRLLGEIERDRKKLRWFCVADPGTVTCFAVLFGCINKYTQRVYLLDEIYETVQAQTSVNLIGNRIISTRRKLWELDEDWVHVSDSAASWFILEMMDRFSCGFIPVDKMATKKDVGLSLIKDALLLNNIAISSRCKKLYWEMENYVRDDRGEIPKENDHLIDALRYALNTMGYSLNTAMEPGNQELLNKEVKRFYTPEEDMRSDLDDNEYDTDI